MDIHNDNGAMESECIIMPEPPEGAHVSGIDQQKYEQSVASALRRKVDDLFGLKFFPTIKDYRDYVKFRRYQYARFDLYSAVITCILYVMVFVTRANFADVPTFASCFAAALSMALIAFFILTLILVASAVLFYSHRSISIDRDFTSLVDFCRDLLQSKARWYGEDFLPLLTCMSIGLFLIARTQAGACAPTTTIWRSQSCNPVATSASIPHDFVLLGYASPLVFQLALKGIRFSMIIVSWGISTACVLAAVVMVQGYMQLWTIVYSLFFLYASCEVERVFRISYLQHVKYRKAENSRREMLTRQASNLSQLEKVKRELKIVSLQAEKDKKSMEEERARFRSMVGNVAHDLKTPLQSVGMSIELLRSDLITALNAKPAQTIELQHAISEAVYTSFLSTLDSLTSMSTFMKMSINRCLDFTKANSGMALTPMMESVELVEALSVPIICINSLQSDTKIIVDPIPDEICSFVITDKQWLMENILCLLSNAIKYSTGGIVNLFMKIEFRTHEFISHKVLKITVEDTGIGIPDEARANLFQPFRQAQRMAGGTGLGLFSLSKRIEALGGSYGVHDRADGRQGSAFWISFPYRPDAMSLPVRLSQDCFSPSHPQTAELRASSSSKKTTDILRKTTGVGSIRGGMTTATEVGGGWEKKPALGSADDTEGGVVRRQLSSRRSSDPLMAPSLVIPGAPTTKLRILIIEDSLSILKVVAQMLRSKGHHVDTATNGSLGLDRLILGHAQNEFDVCLCDLQMPVMDGIECTRRYREYEKHHAPRKSSQLIVYEGETHPQGLTPPNKTPVSATPRVSITHNEGLDLEKGFGYFAGYETTPQGGEGREGGEGGDRRVSLQSATTKPPVANARLPIIGMSANNDDVSQDSALQAGMNLFIAKPFTIRDLERVLEQYEPRAQVVVLKTPSKPVHAPTLT